MALAALCAAGVPRAEEPPAVRVVIRRAGEAAERFASDLKGVVARERYVQTVRAWSGRSPTAPSVGPPIEARRLLSSLLLVHDQATPWQLHRDVVEVDDVPVVDREDRLAALFAGSPGDAAQRLREITNDSARHNLGHVLRNINVPTFPLIVVHPTHAGRFRFGDRGRVREAGLDVRLVSFREKGRPRVIRGARARDVELQGVLAIDEATGELVRATITPRAGDMRSHLEVVFARVATLPVRVPVRLWEWYWVPDVPERDRFVEGEATYDDFRRFTTAVGTPIVR